LFLLAEDVDYLKFRYYKVKKLSPAETELQIDKSKKYEGQWVNAIEHNNFQAKVGELTEEGQTRLHFETKNKISLPRAVEVSLGLNETGRHGSSKKIRTISPPPLIIPLYSGMKFALPLEDDKNI